MLPSMLPDVVVVFAIAQNLCYGGLGGLVKRFTKAHVGNQSPPSHLAIRKSTTGPRVKTASENKANRDCR